MKLLTNRNGSYLTGDALADAVMHYGLALSRKREIDVVNIPFLASDGSVRRVQLAVGWNIDTTATSGPSASGELVESATVLAMHAKAESMDVLQAHPFSNDEVARMRWQVLDSTEWV